MVIERPPGAIDLPSGGWAVVSERVLYGQRRRVRVAIAHGKSDDPELASAADAEVVVAMTVAWSLAPEVNLTAIDQATATDIDVLYAACVRAYAAGTVLESKAEGSLPLSPKVPR